MSRTIVPASHPPVIDPGQTVTGAKAFVYAPEQFRNFASLAEAFYYNATENPHAVAYDQAQRDNLDEHGRRRYLATSNEESKHSSLKSTRCRLPEYAIIGGSSRRTWCLWTCPKAT